MSNNRSQGSALAISFGVCLIILGFLWLTYTISLSDIYSKEYHIPGGVMIIGGILLIFFNNKF